MVLPDGIHITVLHHESGGISAFMTGSGGTGDTPILSAAMAKIPQSAGGEAQLEGCNAICQRFAPL